MLKYIAIGFFIPFCVLIFYCIMNGFKIKSTHLALFPFILLFCGLWSIFPNIINKLGVSFLNGICNNYFISNIFFFHGILKKMNTTGSTWGLLLIFCIFFTLIFLFSYQIGIQERDLKELRKGK
ncbi:hypothetical protein ACFL1T_02600 [Chlamydiota bacterium]